MMICKDAELASNLKYFYCVIILNIMVWLHLEVQSAIACLWMCKHNDSCIDKAPPQHQSSVGIYTYRFIYTL